MKTANWKTENGLLVFVNLNPFRRIINRDGDQLSGSRKVGQVTMKT